MADTDLNGAQMRTSTTGLASESAACAARTPRGMRTPTGGHLTCAGGHAPGDLHGAAFGDSGWFSWSDMPDDTTPLPRDARDAMLRPERAFAPAIAEQHRIERIVSGLRDRESTVINGTQVTAVSLAAADLLTRYAQVQSRCRRLAAMAVTAEDYNQLWDWHVVLTDCRCQLQAAGHLGLIGGAA